MGLSGKKKAKLFKGKEVEAILTKACHRRVLGQISSGSLKFAARFILVKDHFLFLENTLGHLDDVRQLRNRELLLFFSWNHTLLKGHIELTGLTTYQNMRVLRFSLPETLTTDEKRTSKRIQDMPKGATLTFSTLDMRLFHGTIVDVSLRGMGFVMQEKLDKWEAHLKKGTAIQVDAILGDALKLSFDAEIRYTNDLSRQSEPGSYKVGVKMLNLTQEAMNELHQWIFEVDVETIEKVTFKPTSSPVSFRTLEKTPNSILVIATHGEDIDFWQDCLGRKYELITSDLNIANIRLALNTGPMLVLVHLDVEDSSKCSFIRKLCASFMDNQAMMFFGEEPDPRRQQTLMGSVKNRGFLDTSERKVLAKFRMVDEVMNSLNETTPKS